MIHIPGTTFSVHVVIVVAAGCLLALVVMLLVAMVVMVASRSWRGESRLERPPLD